MANFTIDTAHSSIQFEVKHMMVSKVKGQFDSYKANVTADNLADLTTATFEFSFDVATINTKNTDRDDHLRSPDFFDVEQHPTIEFVSTSVTGSGSEYKVTGDLTIKGITNEVTFDVEYNGSGKNPWGVEVHGLEAETKINRERFGLTWNQALETGGVLVGKDIKVKVELELNRASA